MKIPIDQIIVSKDNPRQTFDEESLRRLGESIKTHGQLQAIIVRKRGSNYELVVGERRLRASVLVGLSEIEAEVKDVDAATAMELRLIENTQREDLSDAEKGDAVLSLWANYDKYETIKDVAQVINANERTVEQWISQSRKLSPKAKEYCARSTVSSYQVRYLVKYPHSIQNEMLKTIVDRGLSGRQVLELTKLHDANPQANSDILANKLLRIETVTVPKTELPSNILEKIEEKKQLAKVQRIRKKPSKPLNKEQIRKNLENKVPFKFMKVRVSRGIKGLEPPLKSEIKPLVVPIPDKPNYRLCQCAMCSLYGKHCKGRCWS